MGDPRGVRRDFKASEKRRFEAVRLVVEQCWSQSIAAQRERLTALLLEGPEAHGFPTPLWTCPRVARLIGDEFGVDYHERHVWKILRGLGWSPQRPVGQARERNEEAIRTWKHKT